MKKIILSFFVGLLLSGCARVPVFPLADRLWYAENEVPDSQFHVYVYFKDDSNFIYWRTKESQEVVMRRWAYYTHDHPGVDTPVQYKLQGDRLQGLKRFIATNSEGVPQYTATYEFAGSFKKDNLEMEIKRSSIWADGTPTPQETVRWSMKRLRAQ